ncbi:MAG: hypothetical protein ACOY99_08895 [Pseudomonadota bacterium]
MKIQSIIVLAPMMAVLGSCASIISGTSQEITINTNPTGAKCLLERNGQPLAKVDTPETITIKKTKHDITVTCDKDGFETATYFVKSEIQDATWGNIVAGGGIGWAIDSASGADNKYERYVNVTLVPKGLTEIAKKPTASQATEGGTASMDVTKSDNNEAGISTGEDMQNPVGNSASEETIKPQ